MGVSRAVMGVKEGREKATTTTITMVKVASRVVVIVVVTRVTGTFVLQQSCGDLSCVSNESSLSAIPT